MAVIEIDDYVIEELRCDLAQARDALNVALWGRDSAQAELLEAHAEVARLKALHRELAKALIEVGAENEVLTVELARVKGE